MFRNQFWKIIDENDEKGLFDFLQEEKHMLYHLSHPLAANIGWYWLNQNQNQNQKLSKYRIQDIEPKPRRIRLNQKMHKHIWTKHQTKRIIL